MARARARLTRCCSPPERAPRRAGPRGARPPAAPGRLGPVLGAQTARDLAPAQRQLDVAPDAGAEQSRAAESRSRPVRRQRADAAALRADGVDGHAPGVRRSTAASSRSSVVFPAPFGPSTRQVLPRLHDQAVHARAPPGRHGRRRTRSGQLRAHDAPACWTETSSPLMTNASPSSTRRRPDRDTELTATDVLDDGRGHHLGLTVDVAADDRGGTDLRDRVPEPRHGGGQQRKPRLDPHPRPPAATGSPRVSAAGPGSSGGSSCNAAMVMPVIRGVAISTCAMIMPRTV